jgi:putative serine protease PepD
MTESPSPNTPEPIPQPTAQPATPQPTEPTPQSPEPSRREKRKRSSTTTLAAILLIGLIAGSLISFSLCYVTFNGKIESLQTQIQNQGNTYISYPNASYLTENVSLANLYEQVRESVVIIQDWVPQYSFWGLMGYSQQQGSGFITLVNDQPFIVTNNHVTVNSINITVTFANGESYPATLIGSDSKADLAVLNRDAPASDLLPLTVASASTLRVGDPVLQSVRPMAYQEL